MTGTCKFKMSLPSVNYVSIVYMTINNLVSCILYTHLSKTAIKKCQIHYFHLFKTLMFNSMDSAIAPWLKFLARTQCTPYTHIPPLSFNKFGLMGNPSKVSIGCFLPWLLFKLLSRTVWNESLRREYCAGAQQACPLRRQCRCQICPWEK